MGLLLLASLFGLLEVARRTQAVPLFSGITAQGWPYCPGVGRLSASFRVPGGLVWWGEQRGRAYWMWQPLKPEG